MEFQRRVIANRLGYIQPVNFKKILEWRKKVEILQGIEMDMTFRSYSRFGDKEKQEKDSCEMQEVIIESLNYRYILQLKEDNLNQEAVSKIILSPKNVRDIFKDLFFSQNCSNSSFKYKFSFDVRKKNKHDKEEENKLSPSTTQIANKFSSIRSVKRRRVSTSQENYDSILYLDVTFNPDPKYCYDLPLRFVFLNSPRLKAVGILPNEIFIVIFRFLPSEYLLRQLCFANKRFNQLIQSEFMFRSHHIPSFNFSQVRKPEHTTWREHFISNYNSSGWVVFPIEEEEPVVILDHATKRRDIAKVVEVNRSNRDNAAIWTKSTFPAKESHEWVVRFTKEYERGCRDWIGISPKEHHDGRSTGTLEGSYTVDLEDGQVISNVRFPVSGVEYKRVKKKEEVIKLEEESEEEEEERQQQQQKVEDDEVEDYAKALNEGLRLTKRLLQNVNDDLKQVLGVGQDEKKNVKDDDDDDDDSKKEDNKEIVTYKTCRNLLNKKHVVKVRIDRGFVEVEFKENIVRFPLKEEDLEKEYRLGFDVGDGEEAVVELLSFK